MDDGSTDGSLRELKTLAKKDSKVKVIAFKRNYGQTAAMQAGIDLASNDIIIPIDADLQNDPCDIPRLLEKLEQGYDIVSGWRKNRKDARFRRNFVSSVANRLISWISGVSLHDYGCSLKAYRRDVIKGVTLYGEMHRFIPIYAKWQGGKVTEIPVKHHERKHGVSKYGLERTIKVVLDLIVVKFLHGYFTKPIYLFGGLGFISLILSGFTGLLAVCLKFFGNTSFIQTPLPLLTVMFFLAGIMGILMGLLAEMLTRTYFESQQRQVYAIREKVNLE